MTLTVGDLSKRTGVSVRTLHYYDEIGLLSPSHRTEAGYRLYGETDILRLQQIMSLRQISFSLEQIQKCLEQNDFPLERVLALHIARLREQIEQAHKLLNRLETLAETVNLAEVVSVEDLIQTIEAICMLEKYYTPEQLEILKQRREQLGEEQLRQGQANWHELIKQVRAEMIHGTNPVSAPVKALARRWLELVNEMTGGDEGIRRSLNRMYQEEGSEVVTHGAVDAAMSEYIGKAITALKEAG